MVAQIISPGSTPVKVIQRMHMMVRSHEPRPSSHV